jgi:hypothetical protein
LRHVRVLAQAAIAKRLRNVMQVAGRRSLEQDAEAGRIVEDPGCPGRVSSCAGGTPQATFQGRFS